MATLPPGVSLAAAEAILFTGKAVRVLKQPMSAAASHQALRAHGEVLGFAAALQELQAAEVFRPADFELAVETMRAKVGGPGGALRLCGQNPAPGAAPCS